ncbi:protein kinase [Lentzea sp. NPDC058450]|uniref:protein kinase domain-containing protein n=1 Tax=Lentzea sp. NPDC058450 TaxID=3346505 RepID=UPI00365FBC17
MTGQSDAWIKLFQNVTLDEYTVGDLRGEGGFGLVFEGCSADKTRLVALKVLRPGSGQRQAEEFEREGLLLKILEKASNVVDIVSTGETSIPLNHAGTGIAVEVPVRFHVLELSSGSLDEIIEHLGEMSWMARLDLWRAIVRGVHQMHLKSIVHRDLKSENCLLFVLPKKGMDCKLGDLGRSRDLSKPANHSPHEYIQGRGDMRFAPPEFLLLQGKDSRIGHKCADLYGLGSLLFEFGTGQPITSFALGVDPDMVMGAAYRLRKNAAIDLSSLRPQYNDAFELFEATVPSAIRVKASALIRQLCDPDPDRRPPKNGVGKRSARTTGLEWLINQADILTRTLATVDRPRSAAKR